MKTDLFDGLWFGDIEVEDLKDQGRYGGYRFKCAFQIGDPPKEKAKIKKLSRIHIDVGFGDAVKEMPAKQPMPSILSDSLHPAPREIFASDFRDRVVYTGPCDLLTLGWLIIALGNFPTRVTPEALLSASLGSGTSSATAK